MARSLRLDSFPHRQITQDSALEYLHARLKQGQSCALLTGADATELSLLTLRFRQNYTAGPVTCVAAGQGDPQAVLRTVLSAFGFGSFDSTLRDLINLAVVFFREQAHKGSKPVVIVECADQADAFLLDILHGLAHPETDQEPIMYLILTGSGDLRNSPAVPKTADSFDLAAAPAPADLPSPEPVIMTGCLEARLSGKLLSTTLMDEERLSIGRSHQNLLHLPSRFVSRHHALLIERKSRVLLLDLNSKNGVYVNSIKVRRAELVPGDIISIGHYRLAFSLAERPAEESKRVDWSASNSAETMIMRSQTGEAFIRKP
jgi:hypothetical protein